MSCAVKDAFVAGVIGQLRIGIKISVDLCQKVHLLAIYEKS